ncbi:uncharacterized protein E0L32_000374 [Thyridium curvatum]|uniref:GH16 domain-containing protein n=1 Tax=Thyridium curvatum TaxID=1093900 RepID=A0A507BHL4_9PEZI|nr:uncharacterized protein E0L32_000374 [Thyridium curvatum]TPX16040.1 hypothetical protein E0L32_000374 [Thyridium curvatum]
MVVSRRQLMASLLLAAGATTAAPQTGKLQAEARADCDCWHTDGPSSNYFANHKMFDFRHLIQYAGEPAVLEDPESNRRAGPTSDYFRNSDFASAFIPMNWDNQERLDNGEGDATLLMVNSPNNIYIQANNDGTPGTETWMTMRTVRLPDFQAAAELESASAGYQYVSMRMRARTLGPPGAVTAMFTYYGPPGVEVQEADVEILTSDPENKVHYTNQPSYGPGGERPQATRNATMPGGALWTDWATWRTDWLPGKSTWYVNGQKNEEISFQAPKDPASLLFNVWSDGGSWSGTMAEWNEAVMQIQWIELAWGLKSQGSCSSVCNI